MTPTSTAVGPTVRQRWRGARWVLLALAVIVGIAALSIYLTAARPGGRLDPGSTAPEGAHALVALLRDQGVTVIEANDIATLERESRPGTLLVAAQTFHLYGDELLQRIADLPVDRLLVEPTGDTREKITPELLRAEGSAFGGIAPDCDLREATRAGTVQFGAADAYEAAGDTPVTRCYEGILVRYTDDDDRTVTVVGSGAFMMNSGLLKEGNASLAMNLAGASPRVIWYAPQSSQGDEPGGESTVSDLVPDQVRWLVVQLVLAVALLALWRARRVGPLVAEQLPVVVRASETVEGRGRLYRSRRARDRAAEALRAATLQRMLPRLGLGPSAPPHVVADAAAARSGADTQAVAHTLYGPPPSTDDDLVHLSRALDDIERQVAQS